MKKIVFSFLASAFILSNFALADCCQNQNPYIAKDCIKKPVCEKTQKCDDCEKCVIEDDEYTIYNECYCDKKYRKLKSALCLTQNQENCIDRIYKTYKSDMEDLNSRYRIQKNRLLEMIDCENACYKDQRNIVKEIKKEMKERSKCFKEDVKAQLCKKQKSCFNKFFKKEKKKMKKIIKYSAIHKLPCADCCE